jgi:hypothetical protein
MPNSPTSSRANAQAFHAAARRAFFSTLAGLGATALAAGLAAALGAAFLAGVFAILCTARVRVSTARVRAPPAALAQLAAHLVSEK